MTTLNKSAVVEKLLALIEPVCESAGYELVDIQYTSAPGGRLVRVFIDKDGGVSFADCERVSRELSALLDVEDPVPNKYNLEVSSPGLDRPLRKPSHFKKCIGETVKVKLAEPKDGRRNFQGALLSAENNTVSVDVDGDKFELPLSLIESAKRVPDWDAIMASPRKENS